MKQRLLWEKEQSRKVYAAPQLCYEELSFEIAGQHVEVLPVGGHSFDSVLVWIATASVLFAGEDILHARGSHEYLVPHVSKDGSLRDLRSAVARIEAMDPRVLVSSHGCAVIGHDDVRALIRDNRNYLDWVSGRIDGSDDQEPPLIDTPLTDYPGLAGRALHSYAEQFHRGNLQRGFAEKAGTR